MLPIYDVASSILVAYDYRAQEVVGVLFDSAPFMFGLIVLQELRRQVLDEFHDLLTLPLVLALVVVNRVLHSPEQLVYSPCFSLYLSHLSSSTSTRIWAKSPLVSFSSASMSARISARVRRGLGL
ncbi:MAG: hypothetical protein BWY92_01736 [Firmicutes bacterium ADurb.BinA052]|nr:MAG: hypothetical protein BWY92_01736 [Firmicutes bacterium ADurb.BinA052]